MIAIATARGVAEIDVDQPLLAAALDAAGLRHTTAAWDDPGVDWSGFELVVIRSTWDYMHRVEEYLDWVDRVAAVTTLMNPAEVVRWNLDKRYLGELADAGFAVTPTTFLGPGDEPAPFEVPAAGLVVKPVVSAGSNDTARHHDADAAGAHARQLLAAGRPVMVQPYQHRIDEHGETGLVFVDGAYSHAFRKGPILTRERTVVAGLFAEEDIGARDARPDELALAETVMRYVTDRFGPQLYGRVDLVPGDDGPLVLELELVEPSLFLTQDSRAAGRVAAALASRLTDQHR